MERVGVEESSASNFTALKWLLHGFLELNSIMFEYCAITHSFRVYQDIFSLIGSQNVSRCMVQLHFIIFYDEMKLNLIRLLLIFLLLLSCKNRRKDFISLSSKQEK